jgi:hypothetical protein
MDMRRPFSTSALTMTLLLLLSHTTAAQVATLQTPGPDAESSPAPVEELEGEEAVLAFVSCLRDEGMDLPDPQFGADGVRFADPTVLLRIDFRSSEFLDAVEACDDLLASLQPEVDPQQQAEQTEQQLAFAECMRREGFDFPDPDPVRGYTIASVRGPDGELMFDPFDADFLRASSACQAEIGLDGPPGAPGSPSGGVSP